MALLLIPTALTSAGTAFNQIERGERAAVEGMCAALPARASVLIVERVTGDRLTQVVRGTCGVPTARVALLRDAGVSVRPTVTYVADRVRAAAGSRSCSPPRPGSSPPTARRSRSWASVPVRTNAPSSTRPTAPGPWPSTSG
ncbi:hypothetical protein ACFQX6_33030 [Streptosporangium lutulentum]